MTVNPEACRAFAERSRPEHPLQAQTITALANEVDRLRSDLRKLAFVIRHGESGRGYNRPEVLRIADEALR